MDIIIFRCNSSISYRRTRSYDVLIFSFLGFCRLLPLSSAGLSLSQSWKPPHWKAHQRHLQHRRRQRPLPLRQHRSLRQPEKPPAVTDQPDQPLALPVQVQQSPELQGDQHRQEGEAEVDGRQDPADPLADVGSPPGGIPRVLSHQRGLLHRGDPPMPAPVQEHGAVLGGKLHPPQAHRGCRVLAARLHPGGPKLAPELRPTVRKIFHNFSLKAESPFLQKK